MASISSQTSSTTFRKSKLALIFATVGLIAILAGGAVTWLHLSGKAYTDDAQLEGHIHPINARVGGTVVWVNRDLEDTRFVKAGTVLARLDTNDYTPTVDRLKGDLQAEQAQLQSAQLAVPITQASADNKLLSARAAVDEAQAELASAHAGEQAAQAQIAQAEAAYHRAEADRARYEQLVGSHEISRSEYDQRMTDAKVSEAQLNTARANLMAAQQKIEAARKHLAERRNDVQVAATAPQVIATSRSSVERVSGELKKSQAALHDAELNLSYTEIVAPVSGVVGRKQIEAGQRVAPGQLLLNIVPTNDLWVIANFKETQLRHMAVGSPASVYVDSYGITLRGAVESIGGATGSKYALIAPENATGNYVKVVQRIPVRIHIRFQQDEQQLLLPGMSVEASVQARN
jgi:membrane fusion protein, multidrug efflux system